MNKMYQFGNYISNIIFPKRTEQNVVVSRTEAYLNFVYKVLNWEDHVLSWSVVIVFHILFVALVNYEFKFYGFFFYAVIACLIGDFYFEKIGLQAQRNVKSQAIHEAIDLVRATFNYLKLLKTTNSAVYYGLMVTVFLLFSFIGSNVSGLLFVYLAFLSLFFGPYIFNKVPIAIKQKMVSVLNSLLFSEGIAERELLPYLTMGDLNQRDADEQDSYLTDKTQDSITSSLINCITTMPSHIELGDEVTPDDDLSLDEFLPSSSSDEKIRHPKNDNNTLLMTTVISPSTSSDSSSDSELHKELRKHESKMAFAVKHFNGDSSNASCSSDDEMRQYTSGLNFGDVVVSSQKPNSTGASVILSNLTTFGSNLITNAIQTTLSTTTRHNPTAIRREDSDSDFEFINTDDMPDIKR